MRAYRTQLHSITKQIAGFNEKRQAFFDDCYGAAHTLLPALRGDPALFFTNADDDDLQLAWAREQGMSGRASLPEILLAQIEHHQTEVFYNLHPMMFGDSFLARLPGHVRKTIAWRAAPSHGGQFLKHDLIVNNFPSLLEGFRNEGAKTALFSPAHDPAMDRYAANTERTTDIAFVGTYSQYHKRRREILSAVAGLENAKVALYLGVSRLTQLAETPAGWAGPLRKHRRPTDIRQVARSPVFGRRLLDALGNAKIVLNGAIDMAGEERGNLRIWEALGCGCAMLTDEGLYPDAMKPGRDFVTFTNSINLRDKVHELLSDDERRTKIARSGYEMIRTTYSKESQWDDFQNIAG
jgi:Glycosyl transferases group 1